MSTSLHWVPLADRSAEYKGLCLNRVSSVCWCLFLAQLSALCASLFSFPIQNEWWCGSSTHRSSIPLALKFPLQSACEVCLTSLLSLSFSVSHRLSFLFFSSWPYRKRLPLWWLLQSDWVMRGNESLSASETDKGERSQTSPTPSRKTKRVLSASARCRQITANEHMDCSTVKLCCSHTEKYETLISVSISWGEETVKVRGEKKPHYFVFYFFWIHTQHAGSCIITLPLNPGSQPGQANVGWLSSVLLDQVWPSSGPHMAARLCKLLKVWLCGHRNDVSRI